MNGFGNNINGMQTIPINSNTIDNHSFVCSEPINGDPLINPPFKGMLIIVLMIEGARLS